MTKPGLQQFQNAQQQQYNLGSLHNPGWGSHVTKPGMSFMQTTPMNSMYGNIWNQMPYYNQAPLYCNVNYNQLGNYPGGCNNIFGINYGYNMCGMNQNTWNSYNNAMTSYYNAMSSGYNTQNTGNKINRWLTGIYGAGQIINAGAQVMSNLGNNMGTITNGATDGITGALDGLVQGGKNLVNTVAGWFS